MSLLWWFSTSLDIISIKLRKRRQKVFSDFEMRVV